MIEKAEQEGILKPGMSIVEPTSGNTGIGLAMVAAVKGYHAVFTMPESMSIERRSLLIHYGAKIVLTPASLGMRGAVEEAEKMVQEGNYFMPQQFKNMANPEIHRETTAPEILEDLDGEKLDYFVSGIGTGGTITGTGEVLKKTFPDLKIIAVEPADSPVLSGGKPGPHKIQGIGAGFVPDVLNTDIFDEIITVHNEDAIKTSKALCSKEGILAGISAGANVWAAIQIAKKAGKDKNILTVLCDTGERYLSTDLFNS
jgi:cysteine synthase A